MAAMEVTCGADGELLSATEKLVYVNLASYWNEDRGYAWPNMETLAKRSQVQRRRCAEVVARLERKGLVTRISRREPRWGQVSNAYDVLVPDHPTAETPLAEECIPPCGGEHGPLAEPCKGGCEGEHPPDAEENIGPMQRSASKRLKEQHSKTEPERDGERAPAARSLINAIGPVNHVQRGRLRKTYDDELRALAERVAPESLQKGLRMATDRLGAF